ncbi:hypothetical protein GCG54_00003799 [Colletotrichum gloeosporioides]|uniref:Uncharacterized protein n=1 Tax=Colletotrichum gloeosporioides TaxID=474922 RepID=A0A8H4FIL8_COLGL|nr:uncharacterized protein GCG54_00003799 [Colletotrichum gloeosporioides]KAF3802339.1 hypothetical protein GCG54_00003799 [Colletotrichum gloeosporioides]
MANLAVIYVEVGRKKERSELFAQIAEIKERIVALGHGDFRTLQDLSDMETTYFANRIIGTEHPMTLLRMHLLALTYGGQSE